LSVACQAMMVKNLQYQPINEQALRQIIAGTDTTAAVPSPDPSVWKPVARILEKEKIELGQSIQGLTKDQQRFQELKDLYQGRNYLLEAQQGKPYIVLREGATAEDRFTAAAQAIRLENLAQSQEYQERAQKEGPVAADRWLTETSLKKTPSDPTGLLEQCKKAGWSSDLIRMRDLGNRARWGDSGQMEVQYELDLPKPE